MNQNNEILSLTNQKQILETKLSTLIYGSIEIRENNNNKYIYVHQNDNGRSITKYIGEYTEELANLILKNNIEVRNIKKEIRKINKELSKLGYSEINLDQSVKNNIDFAKRNLVDTIYKQAILEGVATTYADTEDIIEGGKVNNMTAEDVLKIINLKHAWEFILNEYVISSETNYYLLCQINKLVEEGFYYNAGILRNIPVKIGGTTWIPNIPIESQVKENISLIINNLETNDIDKSIELLLFATKGQLFIDGNKRTALIFANHYLISHGLGLLVIPENKVDQYKKLLIEYYETNNIINIKEFLLKYCYIKM